ncbi:CMRF35-like molecule 5 [Hemiscyllium ocellatum]|uniref:CMRF35-like molecule 5 n=1 Tax=Hemiscyllium ocellatum TaxID=170820 RepID=UPI002966D243|nr:CMRF35-like molecule 5 [Hemiscyllium ocellatum]
MKIIVFFILISVSSSHQLTGPKKVRGEVGGSVTVDCHYDQKYKEHIKKWCQGLTILYCPVIVSTDYPKKERVSLTDNKTHGIFSVTMDNLRKSDEGVYWCEIEVPLLNVRDSIKLDVFEAPTWGSTMGPTSSTAGTTPPPVTTARVTSPSTISSPSDGGSQSNQMDSWQIILTVVILIIFLLLTAAVLFYAKLKQQKKSVTVEPNTPGVGSPASSVMEDTNVIYSTVKKVPKANLESTYINLQDLPPQRTAKDQSSSDLVEYSTVRFRS